MTTIYQKLNKIMATGFLAIIMFSAIAPSANASVLDWFKSSSKNTSEISSSNAVYLSSTSSLATVNAEQNNGAVIVGDKFILASNTPTTNASNKTTNSKTIKTRLMTVLKELIVPITGYSSTVDQCDDSPFISANGTYVYDGMVAANFLPFGTKIKIPEYFGDKVFTVEDRMNKRYNQKIDIWFPDRDSALEFGSRTLKIQIVGS